MVEEERVNRIIIRLSPLSLYDEYSEGGFGVFNGSINYEEGTGIIGEKNH